MNKLKIFFCILIFGALKMNAAEPFVTAGNSSNYTLDDLVTASSGALIKDGDNFKLLADITISSTDKLIVNENATILCDASTSLIFEGIAEINPPEYLNVQSLDISNPDNFAIGIILREDADNSIIKKLNISYCAGLKLYNVDNVIVEDCSFTNNKYNTTIGAGAISLSQCNPKIINCVFENNERSAIQSPANASAAPFISGCSIINNNTSNGNYPQINLGTSDNDTIFIINNYIEGLYPKAGGISVSSLMGGSVNAVIRENIVTNNRYGIAGTGNNIYMEVIENQCLNNNIENDPMAGGSGLNLYATNTTSLMYASENIITGNLWGITLQGAATANLGCLEEGENYNIGKNVFSENGNNGEIFHLYNNTANDVLAENNDWNVYSETEIEETIYHFNDEETLGYVNFIPFFFQTGIVDMNRYSGMAVYPNPANDFIIVDENDIKQVIIFSRNGKKVLSCDNLYERISVANLKEGLYIVSLIDSKGRSGASKLLIERK